MNGDDLLLPINKHHVEGDHRIHHPERARFFLLEDEQHAAPFIEQGAAHETGRPLFLIVGDFDVDLRDRRSVLTSKGQFAFFDEHGIYRPVLLPRFRITSAQEGEACDVRACGLEIEG